MVIDASIVHPATMHPSGPAMRVLLSATSLSAPELVGLEVAGSLRNRVVRNEIKLVEATTALARFQRLPIIRHPLMPLLDRVWELRDNLTPYDAAYVALAERLELPLLTADSGIARAPGLRCKIRFVKL